MRAEISIFAKRRPPLPLRLVDVVSASSSPQRLARLVHEELPVRFARRLKHIERVEGWERVPELQELHSMHAQSFRDLRLADPAQVAPYAEAILQIRQRHKRIPRLFAEAVKRIGSGGICEPSPDCSEQEEPGMDMEAVEIWAETFLRSRVLTEILMSHFEVRVKNASEEREPSRVGIIDLKCDPWQICQAAIAEVESGPHRCQIEAENASGDIEFCHVPRYLFYIMEELLSNSARAASQREEGPSGSAIKVSLCADDSQVVIRISDRAGGIPSSCASKVWSYVYTTAADAPHGGQRRHSLPGPWAVCEDSPVAGRGIGLPLCRLYALYLGGSLHLMNLPGLGVDAYLFLNRIEPQDALDSLQC